VREPAPPYENEGSFALWHVSEDPTIVEFHPHLAATADEEEPFVWAIDTRHLPMYWFPRDCPRLTFWAHSGSSDGDVARLVGKRSRRVHAIQEDWLDRVRRARVVAYRLPERSFARHDVGGYWVSRETVRPLERVELGDLVARHDRAGIELRVLPDLRALVDEVVASTLEYSGVRLQNLER
jgi:hypothetical protein